MTAKANRYSSPADLASVDGAVVTPGSAPETIRVAGRDVPEELRALMTRQALHSTVGPRGETKEAFPDGSTVETTAEGDVVYKGPDPRITGLQA